VVTILIALAANFSLALGAAQFPGLPKVPKLPGQKKTKPAPGTKESGGPPPEVTSITPDSAPPGGFGELVLAGKNFTPGMRLNLSCEGGQIQSKGFKVESAERASAQVNVPSETREGPCNIELVRFQGKAGGQTETEESAQGTPEVFQVPKGGPTFKISNSGKMPLGVELVLIGEGDLNFADVMRKIAQEAQGGFGPGKMKKGELLLAPDSVKYVQEDNTIFSAAPSSVKSIDEMTMMGQSTGVFRIVLGDGKIYNFQSQTSGGEKKGHEQFLLIKKRLGK
jgi:hypothetical protein